jgi:hypothetical protein
MNQFEKAKQLVDGICQSIHAMSEDDIMQQPNVVFFKSLHSNLTEIAPDLAKHAFKVVVDLSDEVEYDTAEFLGRGFASIIVAIDAKITNADVKEMVFRNLSIEL